jgi:hypothetical protein
MRGGRANSCACHADSFPAFANAAIAPLGRVTHFGAISRFACIPKDIATA